MIKRTMFKNYGTIVSHPDSSLSHQAPSHRYSMNAHKIHENINITKWI